MPYVVLAAVALLVAGLTLLFEGRGGERPAAPLRPAPLARIIDRVERERGLVFSKRPQVVRVTPAEARAEAAASLDRDYPPARRRADSELLELLGLLPPGVDLGQAVLSTFDGAVAGYYDSRSGRMRVVEGAQTANRLLYETTVAHELGHALEDQRFGFDDEVLAAGDDLSLAYAALIEGSATALMTRYMQSRFSPDERLGGLLASAFQDTGDLPPFLTAQLTFPYVAGERLVDRLLEVGGGRWSVVDAALRFRPPASTEQVLHPEKYLRVEQPEHVALSLPPGWRVQSRGVMGEWMTGRLLARAGGSGSGRAAAGWGGDSYALLERGGVRALVVGWRWDTTRDAREFARALRAWAREGGPGGVAATTVAGRAATLALAPDLATARALVSGAAGR